LRTAIAWAIAVLFMVIVIPLIFAIGRWRGVERPFTFGRLLRGEASPNEKFAFFHFLSQIFIGPATAFVLLLILEVTIFISKKHMSSSEKHGWLILILVQITLLTVALVLAYIGRRGKAKMRSEMEAAER
jgi:hypothetical protein